MDGAAAASAAACRATPSESEPKVADGIFAELENTFADVVPRRHTHTQYTTPAAARLEREQGKGECGAGGKVVLLLLLFCFPFGLLPWHNIDPSWVVACPQ